MASTHLVILGERSALRWVLTEQRLAFPAGRARQSGVLRVGDEVLLYTTRGCFRNPTRDVGRIIGRGSVAAPVSVLTAPVRFGDREFTTGCGIQIQGLAPFLEGLSIRDLVHALDAFPNKRAWAVQLRRTTLALSAQDAELLHRELESRLLPYADAIGSYELLPAHP
ncbi:MULTISPECIES: hypothetical protein [Streptomyces]|uniref:hypothetical protein n=1 Tax=Streptomyces TaxID=1883 RepID=UPI0005A11ED5|nr:hypothetical protein [Streptomyces albidoflavus]BDH51738.1 hypothetical protein MTP02_27490 [Streptomyces albus]